MKKMLAGLVFTALLLYNDVAMAQQTSARAACVLEMETGRVLFAANETQRLPWRPPQR